MMIPHPPFSSRAHWIWLLPYFARSKVKATGRAGDGDGALMRHCSLLLFWTSQLCDEDESERRCSLSLQLLYAWSWHQRCCASSQKSKPLLGILVEPLPLKLGHVLWEYSFDLSLFTLVNMKLDGILLTLEETRNSNTTNKKVLESMLEMYFLHGPSLKIMFYLTIFKKHLFTTY